MTTLILFSAGCIGGFLGSFFAGVVVKTIVLVCSRES